jgi:hypothetical protein
MANSNYFNLTFPMAVVSVAPLHFSTNRGGLYACRVTFTRTPYSLQTPNFKTFKSPGIDSKEPIPPAYEAWRAGTTTLFLLGS